MNQESDATIGLFAATVDKPAAPPVLAAWALGLVVFGFTLGTYSGFADAWLAAWKLPLAALLAVLITLPSLAVFSALTSGSLSVRRTLRVASLTTATLGALLLAVSPVMWLFASSSWYLAWPVVVATGLGVAALLVVGGRLAGLQHKARIGYLLWLALLIPVTLQMMTTLRPVVTPLAPGGQGRMFFLEHFGEVADFRLPGSSQSDQP